MTSESEKLTAQIRALIVQHCYPFSDVSIGGDRQAAEAIAALLPPAAPAGDLITISTLPACLSRRDVDRNL